jgi:hypothetical protein
MSFLSRFQKDETKLSKNSGRRDEKTFVALEFINKIHSKAMGFPKGKMAEF